MKIKTIIFFIIITFTIFLINLINKDNKIYYVNISTDNKLKYNKIIKNYYINNSNLEKYINIFSKEDYRTTDLIRDLNENKKIGNYTIQNALIKADIVTLYIGIADINYKIGNTNKEELYEYTDQVLNDIDQLLKLIRIYCKEKIYLIGYNNEYGISYDEYFDYTNKRLKSIATEYNIRFINITKIKPNIIDKTITEVIINNK